MKNKLKKINSSYIEGYELGDYYLIKSYDWGNKYNWILSKECNYYGGIEADRELNKGNIKYVGSCKNGKELLVKLYNKEIAFDDIKALYYM